MYWQRKALYVQYSININELCSNLNPFNTDLGAFSMSVELQSAKKVLVHQKYELIFVYQKALIRTFHTRFLTTQ